jgi:hypothetical protein
MRTVSDRLLDQRNKSSGPCQVILNHPPAVLRGIGHCVAERTTGPTQSIRSHLLYLLDRPEAREPIPQVRGGNGWSEACDMEPLNHLSVRHPPNEMQEARRRVI